MDVLKRLESCGIVPVVVLEDAADAVPTAQAMVAGGIDVMEITFRTSAAEESIRNVAAQCQNVLVGAGTVITLEQCKRAVEAGAKFIVSPGFDEDVVRWCVENQIAVLPGCVTPTEIMAAMKYGLKAVKFFPAGVYGGLSAMKALSAPFGSVRFVPTGGVGENNVGEYIAAPYIIAVGGSWVCPKNDISSHKFERITELCRTARRNMLGFEVAHIGINCENNDVSEGVVNDLAGMFGFSVKRGNSSDFVTDGIEVMKTPYLGTNGHIAVKTNCMPAAIRELEKRNWKIDYDTAKFKGDSMKAVYLKNEIGGFAIHLLQK